MSVGDNSSPPSLSKVGFPCPTNVNSLTVPSLHGFTHIPFAWPFSHSIVLSCLELTSMRGLVHLLVLSPSRVAHQSVALAATYCPAQPLCATIYELGADTTQHLFWF